MFRSPFVLVVLAASLAACGSASKSPTTSAAPASPAQAATTVAAPAAASTTPTLPALDATSCNARFGDLFASLRDLDSRLNVGLVIADYRAGVQESSVAYGRLDQSPPTKPDPQLASCLVNVGVRLESALNDYSKALTIWSSCVEKLNCDSNTLDARLQTLWNRAGAQVANVKTALAPA